MIEQLGSWGATKVEVMWRRNACYCYCYYHYHCCYYITMACKVPSAREIWVSTVRSTEEEERVGKDLFVCDTAWTFLPLHCPFSSSFAPRQCLCYYHRNSR